MVTSRDLSRLHDDTGTAEQLVRCGTSARSPEDRVYSTKTTTTIATTSRHEPVAASAKSFGNCFVDRSEGTLRTWALLHQPGDVQVSKPQSKRLPLPTGAESEPDGQCTPKTSHQPTNRVICRAPRPIHIGLHRRRRLVHGHKSIHANSVHDHPTRLSCSAGSP